jgi:hypothetical protein
MFVEQCHDGDSGESGLDVNESAATKQGGGRKLPLEMAVKQRASGHPWLPRRDASSHSTTPLHVIRFKPGVSGNAREHLRPDFFPLMKGKHNIRPAVARQNSMGRAALTFDAPTDAEQGGEDASSLA